MSRIVFGPSMMYKHWSFSMKDFPLDSEDDVSYPSKPESLDVEKYKQF